MTDDFLNVLLVDDDDVAAEAVIRNLRKHEVGCRIVVAEDGRAALEILRGADPDRQVRKPFVTLLDLNMPRMNGFEFLDEIRRDTALQDAVIFVLTTSDSPADLARAYHQNIAGYMVKASVGPQFSKLARLLSDYRSAVRLP
jgi:CheY-like chemotaxis protein